MAFKSINIKKQKWVESEVAKGGYYIPCHQDESTGEFVSFAKLDAVKSYEVMKGSGPVHFFVIKGELIIDTNRYGKGTYIRVDKSQSFKPSSEKGCEVLCIYPNGWELVG